MIDFSQFWSAKKCLQFGKSWREHPKFSTGSREIATQSNETSKSYDWCKLWKIRLNQDKSKLITYTLRRLPFDVYRKQLNSIDGHFLWLTFDRRMTRKPFVKIKQKTLSKLKLFPHFFPLFKYKLWIENEYYTQMYILFIQISKKSPLKKLHTYQFKLFR